MKSVIKRIEAEWCRNRDTAHGFHFWPRRHEVFPFRRLIHHEDWIINEAYQRLYWSVSNSVESIVAYLVNGIEASNGNEILSR